MPQEPIPFVPNQASGIEPRSGASPVAMNIVMEPGGAVRRRPGLTTYSGATSAVVDASGIVGLHVTLGGKIYAVGQSATGGEPAIYRVGPGGAVVLGGAHPVGGANLGFGARGSLRPTIAETEMLLVIARGLEMQKVELSSDTSGRLGGSPPSASHVIANSLRLLANDTVVDRTKARYSSQAQGTTTFAGHEEWSIGTGTAGFFTAEARPDPIVSIAENTNQVFLFGADTTEIYGPDAIFRFSRVSTLEVGISAAHSLTKHGSAFFWLDDRRRIVASGGGEVVPVSQGIQRDLDEMARVDDCFGYRVRLGNLDAVVFTFPSDGRTYVYQTGAGWSQWSSSVLGAPGLFKVLSCADERLVGTTDGKIGQFSTTAATDFDVPVLSYVQTGFLNRGTDAYKSTNRVLLSLKRGHTTQATAEHGWLKYRDRPGDWEIAGPVDLGSTGDTDITLEFPSLGTYRQREWRFEFTGTDELVLVSATEEYEVTDG